MTTVFEDHLILFMTSCGSADLLLAYCGPCHLSPSGLLVRGTRPVLLRSM